jgi:predicted GNAT superfamily acetyltransferase
MTQPAAISIRPLTRFEECADAVRLQREIWGYHDVELLPLRMFIVAGKIGGQAFGAFDGSKMVAFCLAIPGLKPGGKYYLHSHMLGVLPKYRNTGLGRKLKLRQREEALSRGIDLIEWTFDPLELKNAFFNVERLGAVARRYVHNQYGTTTSHLHGGLPTDRLTAEWWLESPRAQAASETRPFERPAIEARIAVPINIAELRKQDGKRAAEIQASVGAQFDQRFREGLTVVGFENTTAAGTYLLGRWDSK